MELFQIWLNLPAKNKMVKPYYQMMWGEQIPVIHEKDGEGRSIHIKLVAGDYGKTQALPPNPDSWAASQENHVTIWLLTLEPHAEYVIRPASHTATRVLHCYESGVDVEGQPLAQNMLAELIPHEEIHLTNGEQVSKLLLLEGEPIHEPISAYGPFVMNTEAEIRLAFEDYQKTQFGGWPWDDKGPVHAQNSGRFARYSDGRLEKPGNNKIA